VPGAGSVVQQMSLAAEDKVADGHRKGRFPEVEQRHSRLATSGVRKLQLGTKHSKKSESRFTSFFSKEKCFSLKVRSLKANLEPYFASKRNI
jgi:hypothetical protein